MSEKDEEKRPPGRPKERLVIRDADEALDALLGGRRQERPQSPCAKCRGAGHARGAERMEKVREDGHSVKGKCSSEYSIWRCQDCGTLWRRTVDSGQWGHETTWDRVKAE